MYTILNKNSSVPTAQRKWNTVFDINSNEWKQIYILPFKALKMFGLCLCHRTKNLLALEDFVHFHNPKKYVQWFHFPFGKNYNLHHQ
jgi:hypothetical protein